LFGAASSRVVLVDQHLQGVVVRMPAGVVNVRGRNAAGDYVVADCDRSGKCAEGGSLGVLPADHPALSKIHHLLGRR
jgi:hypothetical protein